MTDEPPDPLKLASLDDLLSEIAARSAACAIILARKGELVDGVSPYVFWYRGGIHAALGLMQQATHTMLTGQLLRHADGTD